MPKFLDLLVVQETEVLQLHNVILDQRKKKKKSNGIGNIYIKIGLLLQEQIETKVVDIYISLSFPHFHSFLDWYRVGWGFIFVIHVGGKMSFL